MPEHIEGQKEQIVENGKVGQEISVDDSLKNLNLSFKLTDVPVTLTIGNAKVEDGLQAMMKEVRPTLVLFAPDRMEQLAMVDEVGKVLDSNSPEEEYRSEETGEVSNPKNFISPYVATAIKLFDDKLQLSAKVSAKSIDSRLDLDLGDEATLILEGSRMSEMDLSNVSLTVLKNADNTVVETTALKLAFSKSDDDLIIRGSFRVGLGSGVGVEAGVTSAKNGNTFDASVSAGSFSGNLRVDPEANKFGATIRVGSFSGDLHVDPHNGVFTASVKGGMVF